MSEKAKITLDIDAETGRLMQKTKEAKNALGSLFSDGSNKGLQQQFSNIEKSIDKLKEKGAEPFISKTQFQNMDKSIANTESKLDSLSQELQRIQNLSKSGKIDLMPKEAQDQIRLAEKAQTSYLRVVNETSKAYSNLKAEINEAKKNSEALAQAQQKARENAQQKKQNLDSAQTRYNKASDAATQKRNSITAKETELARLKKEATDPYQQQLIDLQSQKKAVQASLNRKMATEAGGGKVRGESVQDLQQKLQGLIAQEDKLKASIDKAENSFSNREATIAKYKEQLLGLEQAELNAQDELNKANQEYTNSVSSLEGLNVEYQKAQDSLNKLLEKLKEQKSIDSQSSFEQMKNAAKEAGLSVDEFSDYSEEAAQKLYQLLSNFSTEKINEFDTSISQAKNQISNYKTEINDMADKNQKAKQSFDELDSKAKDVDAISSRAKQFVGLAGGVQLARRAMRESISVIKELDKAMTEMAVVTNTDIGGYWKQLPQYTQRANELGVSIKSVYESSTLFYQQGLKTEQVVALSNETLKMARIAGLSAADATSRMTNALRGFNMEISQANAQNIADVYSKLAAITASDVNEISNAMTKVASIASSAGMEFENTAAFLSQIIETTRESAETAGTALKTVIARFQELKKDPSGIGEVDGEVIDANKVETALRSVGVALRDSSGEFRNLDQVFMELSSKWDTLSVNTQRYIATVAAGSRQQSRFIALMSDTNRQQELVAAANNAAGASNEQYRKTLESLESKLAQLKNAWDSFVMGIMNSDLIKGAIDLITGLTNSVNALTSGIERVGGSTMGMASRIGVMIGILSMGDKLLRTFSANLKLVGKQGSGVNSTFGALRKTFSSLFTSIRSKLTKGFTSLSTALKVNQAELTKALAGYQQHIAISNRRASGITKINALLNQENITEERRAVLIQRKNLLVQQEVAETSELVTALKLNETQQQQLNLAVAAGVDGKTAAILVSKGYTAQQINEMGAEKAKTLAEELGTKVTLKGILATKMATIWSKISKMGTLGEALSKKVLKNANDGVTASNIRLIASMGLLAVIIGAIIAVVWGLVAAYKAIKASTPEAKLEAATKAANEAAEAAKNASDNYKDLADSLDSLGDKYKNLETLGEGTKEWKLAVMEINSEVLDLVNKNPALAGLVKNERGVLKIDVDSEEVEKVLEKSYDTVIKTQAASIEAQIAKRMAQEDVYYSNLSAVGNKELARNFAVALANGSAGTTREQQLEYLKSAGSDEFSAGLWLDDLYADNKTAFKELQTYGNKIIANQEANNAQLELLSDQVIEQFGDEYTEEVKALADGYLNPEVMQKIIDEEITKAESIDKYAYDDAGSNYSEYWKSVYGDNVEINRWGAISVDGEEKLTAEAAQKQYAAAMAQEEAGKKMVAVSKMYQSLSKTNSPIIKALSDEGKGNLTGREIGQLTEYAIQKAWLDMDNQTKIDLYGSADDTGMQKFRRSIDDDKTASLDKIRKALTLAPKGFSMEASDRLIGDQISGYLKQMQVLVGRSGTEAAQEWSDNFFKLFGDLSDEELQEVVQAFAGIDIDNISDLKKLPEVLIEQIPALRSSESEIKKLTIGLGDLTEASEKLSLEALAERMQALGETINNFLDGSLGTNLSEDLYKKLGFSEFEDQFVKTFDGTMQYIGDNTVNMGVLLTQKLESSWNAATKDINARIGIIDSLKTSNFGEAINGITEADTEGKKNIIDQVLRNEASWISQLSADDPLFKAMTEGYSSNKEINQLFNEIKQLYTTNADGLSDLSPALKEFGAALTGVNTRMQMILMQSQYSQYDLVGGTEQQAIAVQMKASGESLLASLRAKGAPEYLVRQMAGILEDAFENSKVDDALYNQFMNAADKASVFISKAEIWKTLPNLLSNWKSEYEKIIGLSEQAQADYLQSVVFAGQGVEISIKDVSYYMDAIATAVNGSAIGLQALTAQIFKAEGYSSLLYNSFVNDGVALKALNNQAQAFVLTLANMGLAQELEGGLYKLVDDDMLKAALSMDGGSSSSDNKWQNPYNWLYNMNLELNQLLKERNRLEKQYQRQINLNAMSYEEINDYANERLASLKQEDELFKKDFENSQKEIDTIQASSLGKRFGKFVSVANGRVEVDSEAVARQNWNGDTGQQFQSYVDELQKYEDNKQDILDKLSDNLDELIELNKLGKEQYYDLLDKLQEAMENQVKEQIEEQEKVNEAISQTQSDILSAVRESVEYERQIRDNTKKEQDLTDKRSQLAYLRRDTSGANQLAALELQKQIDEESQAYQDSLIDQSLSNIEEANRKAEEQRQQQIDIANQQYEFWVENSSREAAKERLDEALGSNSEFAKTIAGKILTKANAKNITEAEREEFGEELNQTSALAKIWKNENVSKAITEEKEKVQNIYDVLGVKGNKTIQGYLTDFSSFVTNTWITQIQTASNTIAGSVNGLAKAIGDFIKEWKGEESDGMLGFSAEYWKNIIDNMRGSSAPVPESNSTYTAPPAATTNSIPVDPDRGNIKSLGTKSWKGKVGFYTGKSGTEFYVIDGNKYVPIDSVITKDGYKNYREIERENGEIFYYLKPYANGGLADFTGPAWLDGTKSSPELVLNAKDTANFIQLKNILADIMRSTTGAGAESTGNKYYDVDVNVDKLDNDYSVDQVANRIKELILEDSQYRNVNQVDTLRI